MKVSAYLNESACIMELKAASKEEAVKEIVSHLSGSNKIIDSGQFVKDILEREAIGSTGIGHHIAIPHARTKAVTGFVIGFGRSEKGIEYGAIDGGPVNLVFLMGAATAELNLYLRLLAELAKLFMDAGFRRELMAAKTPLEVIQVMEKYEKNK